MSLINDMLRDLEQRRGGQPASGIDALGGVAVTTSSAGASGNAVRAMLLGLAGGLAIAAAAWLFVEQRAGTTPGSSLPTPAGSPAVTSSQSVRPAGSSATGDAIEFVAEAPADAPLRSAEPASDAALNAIAAAPLAEVVPQREIAATATHAAEAVFEPTPQAHSVVADAAPLAGSLVEPLTEPLAESGAPLVVPAVTTRGSVQRERSTAPPSPAEELAALLVRLRERDTTAVTELAELIERHPEAADARAVYVREILRRGERALAEASLRDGLALDPANGELAQLIAHLLVARGETNAALAALEQATPRAADRAEYFALAAALYQREGRHAAAVDAYRVALADAPARGAWWVGLAISLSALDDRAGANSAFQRALIDRDLSDRLRSFANRELGRLETKG